jgi:hypothetical protein
MLKRESRGVIRHIDELQPMFRTCAGFLFAHAFLFQRPAHRPLHGAPFEEAEAEKSQDQPRASHASTV